jgi:hypothetical protein
MALRPVARRDQGADLPLREPDLPVRRMVRRRAALRPEMKIVQGWPILWANFRALIAIFQTKCWTKSRNLGQSRTIRWSLVGLVRPRAHALSCTARARAAAMSIR